MNNQPYVFSVNTATTQDWIEAIDNLVIHAYVEIKRPDLTLGVSTEPFDFIDKRLFGSRTSRPTRGATPEERIRRLREAAAAIREGLTEEELAEMTAAMNEEYIEPVDDDMWKD